MVINGRIIYRSGSIKLLSLDQSVNNIFIYRVWQVVLHSFICECQLPILSDTFPTLKQSILPTNNFYFETIWKPGWIALLLRERFTPINFCWKQKKSCSINNLVVAFFQTILLFQLPFALVHTNAQRPVRTPRRTSKRPRSTWPWPKLLLRRRHHNQLASIRVKLSPFLLVEHSVSKSPKLSHFSLVLKYNLNFCAKKWTQL